MFCIKLDGLNEYMRTGIHDDMDWMHWSIEWIGCIGMALG
jgi:hypothetical protein